MRTKQLMEEIRKMDDSTLKEKQVELNKDLKSSNLKEGIVKDSIKNLRMYNLIGREINRRSQSQYDGKKIS